MTPESRRMFRAACLLSGTAVALGAFAAHGLKDALTPEMLGVFEVGVRYQFYHGLALLACSMAPATLWENRWLGRAGWAWAAGVLVFSGSLYLLALTGIDKFGAITPIGGVAFLLGWVFAVLAGRRGNVA